MTALTLEQGMDIVNRTLLAIDADDAAFIERFGHGPPHDSPREKYRRLQRKRLISDLEALNNIKAMRRYWGNHNAMHGLLGFEQIASEGIIDTAALYGVALEGAPGLPEQCDGRCDDGRLVCAMWHGER